MNPTIFNHPVLDNVKHTETYETGMSNNWTTDNHFAGFILGEVEVEECGEHTYYSYVAYGNEDVASYEEGYIAFFEVAESVYSPEGTNSSYTDKSISGVSKEYAIEFLEKAIKAEKERVIEFYKNKEVTDLSV